MAVSKPELLSVARDKSDAVYYALIKGLASRRRGHCNMLCVFTAATLPQGPHVVLVTTRADNLADAARSLQTDITRMPGFMMLSVDDFDLVADDGLRLVPKQTTVDRAVLGLLFGAITDHQQIMQHPGDLAVLQRHMLAVRDRLELLWESAGAVSGASCDIAQHYLTSVQSTMEDYVAVSEWSPDEVHELHRLARLNHEAIEALFRAAGVM